MVTRIRHIALILALLFLGGMASQTWAYKVTYHILTLPMNHTKGTANTTDTYDGWRTEAVKVEVASASNIQLEAHFKSPLAKNFTYYPASVIKKDAAARQIYQYRNNNKYYLYKAPLAPYVKVTVSGGTITNEEVSSATAWTAAGEGYKKTATGYADMETQVAALADGDYYFSFEAVALTEGTLIPSDNYHVYVTYEYDADNIVAKLDGSENYNILIDGKFLAYNRGRNNRVALVPKENLSATQEELISEDFVYVNVSNVNTLKDKTYWTSDLNKNPSSETKSKFHFLFNYIGEDPYNITIRSAYDKDLYYIEQYGSETQFVKKWYEGSSLFAKTTDEVIIASDENRIYTQTDWSNPSSAVTYDDSDDNKGYYHGILQKEIIWNSFALLNAVNGSGDIVSGKVVFLGTRTTKSDGNLNVPSSPNFYYLGSDNPATVKIKSYAKSGAPTADKNMYEAMTFNFMVKTPFGNTVSAPFKLSEYTASKDIDVEDIPAELDRKYCSYNNKFYKDAAHTQQIFSYSDLTEEPYNIYVGYTVDMPFNAIKPADSYTTATWYELTDAGSTEANGKKIKYDPSVGELNFKNNGASGAYDKTTEFAFVGDPYELRVLYRDSTEIETANRYVGGSTNLGVSDTPGEDYCWDIPNDNTNGSFLLRKFNGTGHWYWNANHLSQSFTYATKVHAYSVTNGNAQTLTFTISDLTYVNGHYIKVAKGVTADDAQVTSTTPTLSTGKGAVQSDGTATVTVNLAANTSGENKTFTLTIQEYNGSTDVAIGAPTVITVTQAGTAYSGNDITYSIVNSTRIKWLELPTRTYTYKIVDKAGHIAVKAAATQPIFSPLSLASIPSAIVSPFLMGETLTFYDNFDNGGGAGTGTSRAHLSGSRVETPNTNAVFYVKYTTANLRDRSVKLNQDQFFNVKLNGEYLYCAEETGNVVVKSKANPSVDDLATNAYLWLLRNRDPYDMLIDNLEAREILNVTGTEHVTVYSDDGASVKDDGTAATLDPDTRPERNMGAWVRVEGGTWDNNKALTFVTERNNASRFIARSGNYQGIYEVMATTGDTVGADTSYYNLGRSAANTVKVYKNSSYAHGNDVLAFRLEQSTAYVYHLIDMEKHDLIQIPSKDPDLILPAEYQSPLVRTYHYYKKSNMTISGSTYEPADPESELADIYGLDATYDTPDENDYSSEWEGAVGTPYQQTASDYDDMIFKVKKLTSEGDYYFKINTSYYYVKVNTPFDENIYVTYEKNDLVTFNDPSSPYMLKFLDPYAAGYYLEDGNDNLTASQFQAIYPYCNGDGSLNIYGSAMQEEQFGGGASTRPRWIWFFDSDHNDPYHVKIHSKSTISYNSVAHPTYLETKAVHFNQDSSGTKHIVTCGSLPGVASTDPTEYMILGTVGHYKLLTTNPINETVVDGSPDKDNRFYVISFEQYWKTYNMIKQCVLGINVKDDATYKDVFSNDESTWVVPTELRSTLNTKLADKGIGSGNWHSYDAIANAVRWNGFNDKGKSSKLVERLEHWYQTFDMGDGTFDIESASIPPVLVLLDRQGWEIMRKPLGYSSSAALDVLRSYDSPMVKEYKFYSNATKATGCHKYTLRVQNGAERDQIKVKGKQHTSTSLADLPPESASGVKDNTGAFNDQFVTYTVKEEYENSYQYHLELHEEDNTFEEWGTPSKFLVLTNGRFYRDNAEAAKPNYLSKPIRQGSAIPSDNGQVYDMILAPTTTYADQDGDGTVDGNNLWYVGPNLNIDEEMGIKWATAVGGVGEPMTKYETKKAYKDKTGFDPYNIQLQHVAHGGVSPTPDGRYLTTHMTSSNRINGVLVADYTGSDYYSQEGSTKVTLETEFTSYNTSVAKGSEGYDHTNLQISNQTFMAVSDANGNMQLMPRFDHTKRITLDANAPYLTTLEDPEDHSTASVENWRSMGPQTTFLVRPQVFEYHIIDNEGNEALRYKTCGEYKPSITEHFKSPLATDFKYYFGYAAYSSAESSADAYTAAATSDYFKKEAAGTAAMETVAKALTVLDDYYFKVGESEPYAYKKVTVTKAYVADPKADATYTVTDCTEDDWTNALAYQRTSENNADFDSDAKALANKGLHYFRIGPTTLYRKVTVVGEEITTEESNSSDWSSHSGSTVADMSAYKTAVDALSSDGTYYYKITAYYSYKKVLVTNTNNTFSTEVAANADISSREITGTFAEVGLNDMINQVYVRYSYDPSADVDEILQGKWLTIKLANKDVVAAGTLVTTDNPATDGVDEKGTGVSLLQGTDKPGTIDEDDKIWQWKFLASPVDPSSEYYGTLDPYAVRIFNREKNNDPYLLAENSPMGVGIKVNGCDRFALLTHPSGGYALAVAKAYPNYDYYFLNGAGMTTSVAATTYPENRQKLTVADAAAYTAAKDALTADGEYYYKYSDGSDVYKKVVVISGVKTEYASDASEWSAGGTYYFTTRTNALSPGAQLVVNDDVVHNYVYKVITNDASGKKLAVSATQDKDGAAEHKFTPYLPFEIQSPLLNADEDYKYYGSATEYDGAYTVVPATELVTLYGLYNDEVFVRYDAYSMDGSTYEVPNKKDVDGSGKVIKHSESKDVAININGGLPYNIIWEDDNMMRSNGDSNSDTDGTYIKGKAGQDLQADTENNGYVWKFQGNDPYALKIYNNKQAKYIHAASAANDAACTLTNEPTEFMLLEHADYDYGVLEMTGHKGSALTMTDDDGSTLGVVKITTSTPKYFIIFGLSTHRLIYHLVLANIDETVEIPYSDANNPRDIRYTPGSGKLVIAGTTQRDLSNPNYQLGTTIFGKTYSVDAGEVSIGDSLEVPEEFLRPNTVYFFYVDNIQTSGETATYQKTAANVSAMESDAASLSSGYYYYYNVGSGSAYYRVRKDDSDPVIVECTLDDYNNAWQDNDDLNTSYKGLEITKLMSEPGLIGGLVQINIGYSFQTGLETNAGEGFVTNTNQNLWYTFEAKQDDGTPYLAHYTNAWGLQAMAGRDTRYTNDYLWSPVGDVYGFKMYNRYMIKNSNGAANVMTSDDISEGRNLKMALSSSGNEVYELLGSNTPGYFRIHPVINYTGTQYYIWKDPADNFAKLSATHSEWTFNLTQELLKPYIERVNYVGGLKTSSYTAHKTVMDKVANGTASYPEMLEVQGVVYNDTSIVSYAPGYYRLHSQPGVSGISPVRYASGYLHDIERDLDQNGNESDAIPMHFYSKVGVSTTFGISGLKSGYTETPATRGDVPVLPTEYDPSTIFYFDGTTTLEGNPRSTMQTQGLYVAANPNGDANEGRTTVKKQRAVMKAIAPENVATQALTFSLMDIGGAVMLIHDGAAPATRRYLNFDQSVADSIYDIRFYHESPTDDAKWCMQPVQKGNTAATNEMALTVKTNNGGDDYYYTTFYAPFDVLLPTAAKEEYDAYTCETWHDVGLYPVKVPARSPYPEGKFVPAGTPVIIRTTDNSDNIKLALPSDSITESMLTCVFSGKHLEQMLEADENNDVYTFGLPFTTDVSINRTTGEITAELPDKANSGVGFYINANRNKEHEASESLWLRNNLYVLHNKIYYRAPETPASAPGNMRDIQFVPVIFDDGEEAPQEGEDETQPDDNRKTIIGDGCVYDILGRKVASAAEVQSGTWLHHVQPGIYILNGRKIYVGVGWM